MPLPDAAAEHYRSQQRLAVATLAATRSAWAGMSGELDASWRVVGPALVLPLTAAQLVAADAGAAYVGAVLDEQGITADPVAEVLPEGVAGVASDGRSLAGLLLAAVTTTKTAIAQGAAVPTALAQGKRFVDTVALTQTRDAGRSGESLAIAARPTITTWTRMLNPPSCSRCVILAGRVYRWNAGFQRHPRCDCRHIPTSEAAAGDLTVDPAAYFGSLTEAEQDRTYGKAGAQAIRDGADQGRVVNARRGMAPAQIGGRDILFTRESVTRRGVASGLGRPRLMPETIYAIAEDRADAIRLLRANRYLAE